MTTRATVIADASWCPKTKAAGWAAWITINHQGQTSPQRVRRSGEFNRAPASSTEAELLALLNGIWLAAVNGATHILAQTDCNGVVHSVRKGRPAELNVIRAQFPNLTIETRHVKGHTSRDEPRYYVNRWCDHNARRVMRTVRGRKSS